MGDVELMYLRPTSYSSGSIWASWKSGTVQVPSGTSAVHHLEGNDPSEARLNIICESAEVKRSSPVTSPRTPPYSTFASSTVTRRRLRAGGSASDRVSASGRLAARRLRRAAAIGRSPSPTSIMRTSKATSLGGTHCPVPSSYRSSSSAPAMRTCWPAVPTTLKFTVATWYTNPLAGKARSPVKMPTMSASSGGSLSFTVSN
mmetsp:Transcript_10780/g.22466  ORF Transcript_10780/g.22466 Transcript_10780/m.22466 type:complete len:202 (+) Transcript_10780:1073-1678(+)